MVKGRPSLERNTLMQDQPSYLAEFAKGKAADEKLAALIEEAVKKQITPLLERLEEIERSLRRNQ
jgi:hypothetical protein